MLKALKAFCDECNRDKSDVHFIFAGWTARVPEWELFSEAWHKCLIDKPSIAYFKTYDADTLDGPFRQMNSVQAQDKKLSLARVICDHRDSLFGYVTTIPHAYLDGKPKGLRRLVGTRIYDWGFLSITSTILEHSLYRREADKIDFVFDKCSELPSCIKSYEEIGKYKFPTALQKVAGTIIPGDDKEICSLQAADLLAGQHALYMRTGRKDKSLAELEAAKVPILVMPASPPPQMSELLRYAERVCRREDMNREMLKYLKSQGIKLNDFK